MTGTGQIQETIPMPKGAVTRVDQYLDDAGEHLIEIGLALTKVADARDEIILAVKQLVDAGGGDIIPVQRIIQATAQIATAGRVAGVSVGCARVACKELRETPAIRNRRGQRWDGESCRRSGYDRRLAQRDARVEIDEAAATSIGHLRGTEVAA